MLSILSNFIFEKFNFLYLFRTDIFYKNRQIGEISVLPIFYSFNENK